MSAHSPLPALAEIAWHQGQCWQPAALPLGLNRGLSFGDGLFETIRCVQGQAKGLLYHTRRMQRGATVLGLAYTEPDWGDALSALWQAAGCPTHARLKWLVFRQGGGAYLPETADTHTVLLLRPLAQDPYCTGGPVRLTTQVDVQPPTLPAGVGKTLSSLHYVLAARMAKAQSADHALLTDTHGHALETEHANLAYVQANTLYLCEGGLPGTTQAFMADRARQLGIPCQINKTPLSVLQAAELVCITNSVMGYRLVSQIDNRLIQNTTASEVLLKTIFHDH
jgi:branched-subunit amino acid aminotransferase/4-amino-4-deoxychorismate lyase